MARDAMVLAAGSGSRLLQRTTYLPKPMLPIAGRPLLERVIEHLTQHGIQRVVINLHHQPDVITQHFGGGERFGLEIIYSYEDQLLGTAGAVKKVADLFNTEFFVIYGDNLTNCNLSRFERFHQERKGIATVALFERQDVSQSGVAEFDVSKRIHRFVEKPIPGETHSKWVSAGILMLQPEVCQFIPEVGASDFGRDVLPNLLRQHQSVYAYPMCSDERLWWIDTPEDYLRVASTFAKEESL